MTENLLLIYQSLPYLLKGSIVTLKLIGGALGLGFIIGIPMAIGQVYGNKYIAGLISFYVWFFRGIPVLVLLFLFYFGLFMFLGFNLTALTAAILVLGFRSAAYQSQIFRGSIQSIGEGQMLAARSLGMSKIQAIWNIILPQTLRISIPGWSNEYSIILKDSAVTYAIGLIEIITRGSFIAVRTYKPMPIYLTCAAIFLILTYGGVKVLDLLENKVKIPGYGERRGEI
ncbi:MAG: polar amino acid ABC transporter permease [Candidatus Infernicultor aquiphilus]|jgi:polar amino acid transport system permease protein|uniref:Polar amino acid ABC transporter permease n=1 Tax=Candidatus Infernicultor aquiphilus TaxID=1805029 RepID=A0A1J5G4A0_9BACT|nr:MAG: polar amino acid ABC transporter permease [Candidatus Atribacteria bacterium CG2_30_33_13]PIU25591.1 MAG: polar amino acid ABC transporter permease [Candidatus Atribacteria bacterium CG08_land_8_20_14_0_20_33_29]PIX34314.1 MAG: polar amino acid ABC transporter permease [Candidatus Atribacteria bacterium CG_4_8_14_3_um_filter_34_18]PJB55765.1 MAG: polar amino acid ABC transporter permease [Candidatus Atribacteria bacterium CG_4_9_14_3_um_filter_33_16]